MQNKSTEELALREILDSMAEGDPRFPTPGNASPGYGTSFDPTNLRQPSPTPFDHVTNRPPRKSDLMLKERFALLVQDLFTRGTLAHAVGTFVLLFLLLVGALWVTKEYLLPTLTIMLAELLYALIPLVFMLFIMCMFVMSLFRR